MSSSETSLGARTADRQIGLEQANYLNHARGLRSWLYFFARLLGDVNAVRKGRIGRRIARRAAGRLTGRALRKIFK